MNHEELMIDVSNVCFYDINDQKVSLSIFKGAILILSGGGSQAAMEEAKKWRKSLEEYAARENVKYIEVAFVGKLPPFFPKQFIKNNILKDVKKEGYSTPPLIDWDGKAMEILGVVKSNLCNIFVIDKHGFLRYKLVEKYSQEALNKIKDYIKKLASQNENINPEKV